MTIIINGCRVYRAVSGKWVVDPDKTDARRRKRFSSETDAMEFARNNRGNWGDQS